MLGKIHQQIGVEVNKFLKINRIIISKIFMHKQQPIGLISNLITSGSRVDDVRSIFCQLFKTSSSDINAEWSTLLRQLASFVFSYLNDDEKRVRLFLFLSMVERYKYYFVYDLFFILHNFDCLATLHWK